MTGGRSAALHFAPVCFAVERAHAGATAMRSGRSTASTRSCRRRTWETQQHGLLGRGGGADRDGAHTTPAQPATVVVELRRRVW